MQHTPQLAPFYKFFGVDPASWRGAAPPDRNKKPGGWLVPRHVLEKATMAKSRELVDDGRGQQREQRQHTDGSRASSSERWLMYRMGNLLLDDAEQDVYNRVFVDAWDRELNSWASYVGLPGGKGAKKGISYARWLERTVCTPAATAAAAGEGARMYVAAWN